MTNTLQTLNLPVSGMFWAFIYNSLGIPLGAGLFYPFVSVIISPKLAGLFMAISSITVTLNTLLLKGFKPSIRRNEITYLVSASVPAGD